MYAGEMVEQCSAEYFYTDARHPYSRKLMASVPTLREDKELQFIPGQPLPSSTHPQDAGLQTDVNSALGSAVSIRL